MQYRKGIRPLLIIIIALGWFAIIGQFCILIENRVAPIPETIIRFFSFFTILTNILVAISCMILLFSGNSVPGKFLSKKSTLGAITVYITVVGIIYNSILRFLWKPEGLQWIVDELLHTVVPILFLLLWIFFIPKSDLKFKSVFAWLLYPLIYLLFILTRGSFSGFYPYPFIDVSELGYERTFVNSAGMMLVFLFFSFLFIAIDRYIKKDIYN